MKSKDRIIIQKIIGYIDDIEKYVDGLEAKDFLDDKKTITACAFTVSQVHDYENVDLSVLWGTIKESLPELKDKLKDIILKETDSIF